MLSRCSYVSLRRRRLVWFVKRPEDLTLSLALRSRRECRSMCWASSAGGDGVTTRRSALLKRPCSPGETVCGVARRHGVAAAGGRHYGTAPDAYTESMVAP